MAPEVDQALQEDPKADTLEVATATRKFYLHPGRIFVSAEPTVVTTILGSCVAVCLWDPVTAIGGMNHYLLPYGGDGGLSAVRFGNVAVALLVKKLLELGGRKEQLQAKLCGGASVITSFQGGAKKLGAKNVEIAQKLLADERIPIVSEDVGGQLGRKLLFHTRDGTAWVKRL